MFVVFEDKQVERGNQAIGSVAGDQIDLLVLQGASEKAEIHDLRRGGEVQAVGGHQSFVAIGTFHEFVTESGAPLRSVGSGLRDGFQTQAAGVVAANFDGESVVEAERCAHGQIEALLIFGLNLAVNAFAISIRLFLQDGGEGSAGIFRINIDTAGEDGLLADESASEIKAALDRKMSLGFDL